MTKTDELFIRGKIVLAISEPEMRGWISNYRKWLTLTATPEGEGQLAFLNARWELGRVVLADVEESA